MTFFQKSLSQGFGQRMANFPTNFFRRYRPGIFFYAIVEQKKRLSRLYKQEVQKVEKLPLL